MSDNKKYYYLKLKEDFFDNEEMKVLESMKNGTEYQNVYLKMCLLSLKSDGALLFKNMLPYSLEMLSSVLRVNIDTIKTAVELFQKIGLITVTDTETIYMTDIQSLVGQSSTEADRIRKYRQTLAEKQQKQIECTNDVQMYTECTEMSQSCTPEIRDKSIEIRDKNSDINSSSTSLNNEPPKLSDFNIETDKSTHSKSPYSKFYELHTRLYNQLVAEGKIPNKPVSYNYGLCGKRFKDLLKNPYFTEENILLGITHAYNDPSCIKNKFALQSMLSEANMTRLIEERYISDKTQSNYKNTKQRGSFASEVYGKEQNWEIE